MSGAMQTLERQWSFATTGAGLALALVLAWGLAGCGRTGSPAGDSAAGTTSGNTAADTAAASSSADDAAQTSDADLVSAVNPTAQGGTKPITVKFRIEARPVVGMPVKILLVMTPADQAAIERIHVSATPGDGLLMQSPPAFDLTDLKADTPLSHEVTVVPQQTGVLDLGVTLLLQQDKSIETRTYSIPLIAADNSSTP